MRDYLTFHAEDSIVRVRFKTVNGMDACATGMAHWCVQWRRKDASFKTVNGMDACATSLFRKMETSIRFTVSKP